MFRRTKNWRATIDRYLREGRPVSGGLPVTQPTAQEIIAGPATLYVSPVGTALPAQLTTSPSAWPPVWTGWTQLGYTEKGVDLITTPTIKPFTPDEVRSPVYDIAEAEKAELSVVLAQATLDNLSRAISASQLVNNAGAKLRTFSFGNFPLTYLQVAAQGPTPVDNDASGTDTGDGIVAVFYKAITMAAVSLAMTRQSVRLFQVKWDARQITGKNLYDIFEVYH